MTKMVNVRIGFMNGLELSFKCEKIKVTRTGDEITKIEADNADNFPLYSDLSEVIFVHTQKE